VAVNAYFEGGPFFCGFGSGAIFGGGENLTELLLRLRTVQVFLPRFRHTYLMLAVKHARHTLITGRFQLLPAEVYIYLVVQVLLLFAQFFDRGS